MDTLFPLPEKEHVFGGDKNLQDIELFLRPILEEAGFVLTPVKEVPTKESQIVGNTQWITSKEYTAVPVKCQMSVVDYVKQIQGHVRYDMPASIVKATAEKDRVKYALEKLGGEGVCVLLFVRTGWFVFFKYGDIPTKYWHTSYRHKDKKVNRMYVAPEYLDGTLLPVSKLKETLLNHMKNENSKG